MLLAPFISSRPLILQEIAASPLDAAVELPCVCCNAGLRSSRQIWVSVAQALARSSASDKAL